MCFFCISCGGNSYKKGRELLQRGDYNSAILQLRVAETKQPGDWRIKRDLGVAFYKNRQTNFAITKLNQARQLKLDEPSTLLYLGLSYEAADKLDESNATYRTLASLNIDPILRKEILVRMRDNQTMELRKQVKQLIADWQAGREIDITPNTVGVLYFRNVSEWDEMNPVLKGLAEIVTNHLQRIKNLRVVDRLKVQLLLDELGLSSAQFLDQTRASDIGQLLNAERLIFGGVERLDDTAIRISAGVVYSESGKLAEDGIEVSGSISDILDLEKKLVLDLVKDLGIGLNDQLFNELVNRPLVNNSQAFLAFCRGLDFEDQQIFSQARLHYNNAVRIDPGFDLAKLKLMQLPENRLNISDMERLVSQQRHHENIDLPLPTFADLATN
jgi:tetratricopeptide (TPR) repeat protein